MSDTLRESADVGCSAADAHEYLTAHFASRAGIKPTVLLRVPIADLALDREVVVDLTDLPSRPAGHVMEVSWSAAGGGPYPTFIGSLVCLPSDAASSRIELEGAYTIPGGVLGRAFDAAIGHRIASAAAHSLLRELVRIIESARDTERISSIGSGPKAYPPTYE